VHLREKQKSISPGCGTLFYRHFPGLQLKNPHHLGYKPFKLLTLQHLDRNCYGFHGLKGNGGTDCLIFMHLAAPNGSPA
ncbi:MAG: hypothetical protein KC897_12240, partial [Candidatus Omnitrophica bacterium]|nr:hypothetical protein [Candidatus Omnitrophota bacterium]